MTHVGFWSHVKIASLFVSCRLLELNAIVHTHTHTHTRLTALCPGLPGWTSSRKGKPIWILLKQETVSGSAISWAICMSAPHSSQITTPAPHHSVFTCRMPFLSPNQQRQSTECYSNHIITRISIQTAGLAFGGTGLCSYRVRGVDGSRTKHLNVESYMVIYAANSHTYYY